MDYFKLSKRDIRHFTIIYKICASLCIIPNYSFEKSVIEKSKFKKLEASLLVSIIVLGTIYSIYTRHYFLTSQDTVTHLIVNDINEFFLITIPLHSIIASTFGNSVNWLKLNNNLQFIDTIFNNKGKKEKFLFNSVFVQLVFYSVTFLYGILRIIYLTKNQMGTPMYIMYALHEFCYLYNVLLHFLIINIAMALKYRYEDINGLLNATGPPLSQEILHIRSTKSIRKIGSISRILAETVEAFNNIFGLLFVLIIGRNIMQMLRSLNYTIDGFLQTEQHFKDALFFGNIILIAHTMVKITIFSN
jgi:hypothetical protein